MREESEKELATEIPLEVKKKVISRCKKRKIYQSEYFRQLIYKDLEKACKIISSEASISKKLNKKRNIKIRISNKVKNEVISRCKKRKIFQSEYFRQLIYKDLEKA